MCTHAEADPDCTILSMEYAVLHFGSIQRLACCTISASAELLVARHIKRNNTWKNWIKPNYEHIQNKIKEHKI